MTGTYPIGSGTALGIFGAAFGIPQPDPDGHNALILQAELNVFPLATQSVSVPSDGPYALSFFAANRATAGANGPQTISVLLDGTTVGTFGNLPIAWTLQTLDFNTNCRGAFPEP